jgi:glycosyltransferase involved in cell wall biosynthesis
VKILVFAHQLEIGGTQTNAIELAAALRDVHGHEVVVFATPGPMVALIKDRRLSFIPAPNPRFHPSPARMRALREAVRSERPDLIHVWDWWQCLDAYYAVHVPMRLPMVVTDMMMNLTRLLPTEVPTTFGTPELVERARAAGRRRVELLLPPVDVRLNAPNVIDASHFRDACGIEPGDITLVTVSRLAEWMKSESLLRTIEAVRILGRELPLRLIIVGDGTARRTLEGRASAINAAVGRRAVVLVGAALDPRPAYAAADIVLGMGGSALRGMAFGKPIVVLGEHGFAAPLTPATAASFHYAGIYGRGNNGAGNEPLVTTIRRLAQRADERAALGAFARHFVLQHYSLDAVSGRLARFCEHAAGDILPLHVALTDGLRTAAVYVRERRFLTTTTLARQLRRSRTGPASA